MKLCRTNLGFGMSLRATLAWTLSSLILAGFSTLASAQSAPSLVHGLWVWKSQSILEAPTGAESLRDFCKSQDITEVYVSISGGEETSEDSRLTHHITVLHGTNIHVEALLSSANADEPGEHRNSLLDHVQEIVRFNQRHPADRFDGIHLDLEPQQRPENQGAGNLKFLPNLVDAFRAVQAWAVPAGMTVNADIQAKLLKGDPGQRRMLLSAVPRVTLMMYELSRPGDGKSADQMAAKVQDTSQRFLNMAFDGLDDPGLARMIIALRTPDYGDLLPQMLEQLDGSNRVNPHYLGWARHSYNDVLKPTP
jgi:hypothetical protein